MEQILIAQTVQSAGPGTFFAGWGTLALINAGLAQSKNRSGLNWWFLSLFLGPIATFLVVLSDKLVLDREQREPPAKDRLFSEI